MKKNVILVTCETRHADFNERFRILKFRIFRYTFWYTFVMGIF